MAFRVENGRPVGTQEVYEGVIHYTCNPPDMETLTANGITCFGDMFDVDPREVLLIPYQLFQDTGLKTDTVSVETLLVRLR